MRASPRAVLIGVIVAASAALGLSQIHLRHELSASRSAPMAQALRKTQAPPRNTPRETARGPAQKLHLTTTYGDRTIAAQLLAARLHAAGAGARAEHRHGRSRVSAKITEAQARCLARAGARRARQRRHDEAYRALLQSPQIWHTRCKGEAAAARRPVLITITAELSPKRSALHAASAIAALSAFLAAVALCALPRQRT